MTGLHVSEFDELVAEVMAQYVAAERRRLSRPGRQRDIGAGHPFALRERDHIMLTVVWLRVYPIQEVLGYLFGVSDTTARRVIERVLPVLEKAGRDTMRLPDPGRKRRRKLDELLRDTPELAVVIDSFEQRVQRPRDKTAADSLYSGKKKTHTLKSQVAVDEETGQVVDVAERVAGPTADMALLAQSTLMDRLPEGLAGLGIWPMWASTNSVVAQPLVANLVVKPALLTMWLITPPSLSVELLLNTPLVACVVIKSLLKQIAIIVAFTPHGFGLLLV
jgi:hypothetical protein